LKVNETGEENGLEIFSGIASYNNERHHTFLSV